MTLRKAELEDVATLYGLAAQMHSESVYSKYNFDEAKVLNFITYYITHDHCIAIKALDDAGEIIGGFFGTVIPHYFGNDLQAFDVALFIHPDYRGTRTALHLIKAYREEAIARGASQVMLANSTGVDSDRVGQLFARSGFNHVGGVYSLHVDR